MERLKKHNETLETELEELKQRLETESLQHRGGSEVSGMDGDMMFLLKVIRRSFMANYVYITVPLDKHLVVALHQFGLR